MNSSPVLPIAIEPAEAQLPQRYEAARMAIAACEQIDECKDWKDKAAALASYARQAKDNSLRVMAMRIQARAERRCGELLKLIPRADEATRYGKDGAVPPVTRTQAATDAGLSERQRKTALRIASIPAPEFERQIDAPNPPTVTQLAQQGTLTREQSPSSPWASVECPTTRDACETLERFARFCDAFEPSGISRSLNAVEADAIRQHVAAADKWLDRLMAELSAEF